jgi:hypothetical protein
LFSFAEGRGAAVPHYHFHIRDGASLVPDREGAEWPDLHAAAAAACAAAKELIIDAIRSDMAVDRREIELTDCAGRVLAKIRFHDVIVLDSDVHGRSVSDPGS